MPRHKRLRVTIYGLFPTIYSTCAPCCAFDPLSICAPGHRAGQAKEYPRWIASNQEFAEKLIKRLDELSERIDFEIVGADTLKGFFLSIQHGLGSELAVIVDGMVFRGDGLKIEEVVEYVRRRLEA